MKYNFGYEKICLIITLVVLIANGFGYYTHWGNLIAVIACAQALGYLFFITKKEREKDNKD